MITDVGNVNFNLLTERKKIKYLYKMNLAVHPCEAK